MKEACRAMNTKHETPMKTKTMKTPTHATSGRHLWLARNINLTLATVGVASLLAATSGRAGDDYRRFFPAPELPAPVCDEVNVPAGNRAIAHVYASGVQIYRWTGTNWLFIAPAAVLFADPCHEAQVGIHYAGPTWEASDGSKVTGVRLAGCTPDRGAIPWLRLGATSAPKEGRFARLTYIQRINTIGGTAPAEPGAFIGDEARVPYTTEYYFYRATKH